MYKTSYIYNQNTDIISVEDIVNEKQTRIHKKMYDAALSLFLKDKFPELLKDGKLPDKYVVKEITLGNLLPEEPTKVLILDTVDFTKQIYSLKDYWPEYKFDKPRDIISKDFNIYEYELIDKNYLKGTNTLRNRHTGEVLVLNFNETPDGIRIADEYSLNSTFTSQINID